MLFNLLSMLFCTFVYWILKPETIEMNLERAMEELLETLKYVKNVMDSDDYSMDFDKLYDHVSSVITKYEGD